MEPIGGSAENVNQKDLGGERPVDFASDEVVRVALGAQPLLLHQAVASRQLSRLQEALAPLGPCGKASKS